MDKKKTLYFLCLAVSLVFYLVFGYIKNFDEAHSSLTDDDDIDRKSYLVWSRSIYEESTTCGYSKTQHDYLSFKFVNIPIDVVKEMETFEITADYVVQTSGRFFNILASIALTEFSPNSVNGAKYSYSNTFGGGSYSGSSTTNLKLFCTKSVCNFTLILHHDQFGFPPIKENAKYRVQFYNQNKKIYSVEMPDIPRIMANKAELYPDITAKIGEGKIYVESFIPVPNVSGAARITWQENNKQSEEVFLFDSSTKDMKFENSVSFSKELQYAAGLIHIQLPNNNSFEKKLVIKKTTPDGANCDQLPLTRARK